MGQLYLLFLPVVNAFNLSNKFTIPIILSFLSIFILLVKKRSKIVLKKLDFLFIVLIISTLISTLSNLVDIDQKMFTHQFAFIAVIVLFYFVPSYFISRLKFEKILKYLFFSFTIAMIFAILEFLDRNIINTHITLLIPRASVEFYEPTFWKMYIRSRSFFEESGHFASYLAVVLPFVLLYFRFFNLNKKLFILFIILFVLTAFCVFSIALFIFIMIGLFIVYLLNALKIKNLVKNIFIFLLVFSVILYFLGDILTFIDNSIMIKFESKSYIDRDIKLQENINLFKNSNLLHLLVGYGLGSYGYLEINPSISVYINFLRDIGIMGLGIFIILNIFSFVMIKKTIKPLYRNYFYFSLMMSLLFFLSIGNYFYPHFWLIYILMQHKEVQK